MSLLVHTSELIPDMHLVDTRPPHIICVIPLQYVLPRLISYGADGLPDSEAFAEELRQIFIQSAEKKNEAPEVIHALTNQDRFQVVTSSSKSITLDLGTVLPGSHWIKTETSATNKPTLEEALRTFLLDKLVPLRYRRLTETRFLVYPEYPDSK